MFAPKRAIWHQNAAAVRQRNTLRLKEIVLAPERRHVVVTRVIVVRHVRPVFFDALRISYHGTLLPVRKVAISFALVPGTQEWIVADTDDRQYAGFSLMMDSNYLADCAPIICAPDGDYISLNEAVAVVQDEPEAFDADLINAAANSYQQMKVAYDNEDADAFALAAEAFGDAVGSINQQMAATNTDSSAS